MKKALVVYHAEVEAATPEAAMRKAKLPPKGYHWEQCKQQENCGKVLFEKTIHYFKLVDNG